MNKGEGIFTQTKIDWTRLVQSEVVPLLSKFDEILEGLAQLSETYDLTASEKELEEVKSIKHKTHLARLQLEYFLDRQKFLRYSKEKG